MAKFSHDIKKMSSLGKHVSLITRVIIVQKQFTDICRLSEAPHSYVQASQEASKPGTSHQSEHLKG